LTLVVKPVFTAVRTFLSPELDNPIVMAEESLFVELEDPELKLDEPDVKLDPDDTSDDESAADPDETTITLGPSSDVTEDDPVFVELEVPALNDDVALRVESSFKELDDPIVMAEASLSVELEDPELKLDELDVKLDPDDTSDDESAEDPDETIVTLAPWPAVTEDDPVFAELEEPVLNEIKDPRLSVLVKPEWKHPAHKGPFPEVAIVPVVKDTVDPMLAELMFSFTKTTVSTSLTLSTDEVSITFSITFISGIITTDEVSTSFWTTCVAGKSVLAKLLSGVP